MYKRQHWYLLTLVSLPLAVCVLSSTWRFINNMPFDDTPRWWMGPMGNWNEYVKAGCLLYTSTGAP